jgi:hypothetical protein
LVSIPRLPLSLQVLICSENLLTFLPELPITLQNIECNRNKIYFLPSLPQGILSLNIKNNPLEILPEFPHHMIRLTYDLPNSKQTGKRHVELYALTPERVQMINKDIKAITIDMNQESRERVLQRCKIYKEEIMMKVWHPSRVEKLLKMGYDIEDM